MPIIEGQTESDLLAAIEADYRARYIREDDVTREKIMERLGVTKNQAESILQEWGKKPGYQIVKLINNHGKVTRALRKV